MKVLSPKDIKALDENSQWLGISVLQLMENAGKNIAEVIENLSNGQKLKIVAVCGLGNNGGDTFVAARHLGRNHKVTVILVGKAKNITTEEAKKNFEIISQMTWSIKIIEFRYPEQSNDILKILLDADIIIDGILGVGTKGRVKGLPALAIRLINQAKNQKEDIKIIAVDVPSGLDCFAGKAFGEVVKADITVTFHGIKKGMNEHICGKIIVKDIGIPLEAELFVGPGDLRAYVLKKRDPWSYKGIHGRIMIIGGSKEYSGAPALAGLAALHTGADIVVIYAPSSVAKVIRGFSPNLIVRELNGEYVTVEHLDYLIDEAQKYTAIIIGPGLSTKDECLDFVLEFLKRVNSLDKIVVDADALKALTVDKIPKGIIITPHAGEFAKIFGEKPRDLNQRIQLTQEYAKKCGCVILLKGHIDVISNGGRIKLNVTGNPGMTVGGTGDVLDGIIATFLAQEVDRFWSACAGAFINGAAGDLSFSKYGYSLTATDVINEIPTVLKMLYEGKINELREIYLKAHQ